MNPFSGEIHHEKDRGQTLFAEGEIWARPSVIQPVLTKLVFQVPVKVSTEEHAMSDERYHAKPGGCRTLRLGFTHPTLLSLEKFMEVIEFVFKFVQAIFKTYT